MAVNTRNNIVTKGLVMYMDPANSRSYTSGASAIKDLSITNTSSSWINGNPNIINNSLDIYTNNIYLKSIPNISMSAFPQQSCSICVWINATYGLEPGAGGKGYFDGYDGTRNHIFIRSLTNQNQFVAQISNAGQYNTSYNDTSVQPNTWYNYVVTYGVNKNFKIYKNGNLIVNNTPISASWTPTDQYAGYGQQGNSMPGSYGTLMIYNRDISAQEILQNYNATKTRFGL